MQKIALKLKTLRFGDVAIRRNPLFYAQARDQLEALEQASADTRWQWTRAQLAATLWCARRTAYGRRIGGNGEVETWPILDKSTVRADPGAFLSGARFLTAKASTGGTSGAPLPLVRSLRSIVHEQACIDRMIGLLGVDAASARIAVLRGDNVKDPSDFRPPYWTYAAGGRRMVMSSNHLNAATVGAYAEALEKFAPDVFWAYPTSLEALCVQLEKTGRKLTLPRILTSSELLHPEVWRHAKRVLGCSLVDYYGQAERVGFAYAQEPGQYRFLPGYAHVELIPAAEEGLYEIVGTGLWNRTMPLIRYRTGDLVRLDKHASPADITLGLQTFEGVLGRDTDILISPDGVRLTGIDHFQREVANLVRIQVIQESLDDVRILVLATPAYGEADEAKLAGNVKKKLPASMRVRYERTDRLERTALGKAPFVIHRPAVKALLTEKGSEQISGNRG
jgi:phenylacetate-coenzyme A ligase PaaK-like adenylate-forming protein